MSEDFEQLYNTYYMQVYSFVLTLGKSQALAEEITQKAFFKAMASNNKHRGESSEFTWLCAIAKNLLIDEFRANKRLGAMPQSEPPGVGIEERMIDESSAFQIHQVLHGLNEPFKEVFQLRVFGELSFKKIGMLFGKTENWARVTFHRARLKIKERMDDQ